MRRSVLALAIVSLLFAGVALSATATAEPPTVLKANYVRTFAQEAGNNSTPGAGQFLVAIGGIIVFIGVIGFILMSTIRKRKKKGIE